MRASKTREELSVLSDEQINRLADYADATDLYPTSKPRSQRSMRVSQRALKHKKASRTSSTERKALRYSTQSEGWR